MNYSDAELKQRKGKFGSILSVFDRKKFDREFDVNSLQLSAENRKLYDENPHIRQVFANEREFVKSNHQLGFNDRIVLPNSPTTKYARRQGEAKTVDHWGQRKLLFSEIEFLTLYGSQPNTIVVYAGAAPGTHTNYLAEELFPHLTFVLVDPAPFTAKPTKQIEIRNGFFTDEIAKEFKGKKVLFISDIRSITMSMTDREKEERVKEDMKMQEKWVQIIQPYAAMLKFRLPYTKGETSYLDGRIFFPVWGGRTTTETRLVVEHPEATKYIQERYSGKVNVLVETSVNNNNNKTESQQEEYIYPSKTYSHQWYEDLMYHYNIITRTTWYPHNIQGEGLDHCFDCSSEIFILRIYLENFRKDLSKVEDLEKEIALMSAKISQKISSSGRTLSLNNDPHEEEN